VKPLAPYTHTHTQASLNNSFIPLRYSATLLSALRGKYIPYIIYYSSNATAGFWRKWVKYPKSIDFKQNVLVQKQTAPDQNSSALVQNSSALVQNSSAPVQNSSAPVQNSSALVQNNSAPVQNSSAPVQNNSAPVQNNSAPIYNKVLIIPVTIKNIQKQNNSLNLLIN
jgi:hypothetical protein